MSKFKRKLRGLQCRTALRAYFSGSRMRCRCALLAVLIFLLASVTVAGFWTDITGSYADSSPLTIPPPDTQSDVQSWPHYE